MNAQNPTGCTRVLLSFSGAYADLARRLGDDLKAANINVRYDKWDGGGGAPAFQAIDQGVEDAGFVLALLTPSEATRTWIGKTWRQKIYDKARGLSVDVLPVRGDGDLHVVPDFLRDRSFADLREGRYVAEFRRLVATVRRRSGDTGIVLPEDDPGAVDRPSPMTLSENPLVLEVGEAVVPLVEGDRAASRFLGEMVPMMRDGLFFELGVRLPELSLRVAPELPATSVRIVINGIPETQVAVRPGWVVVNDSVDAMLERGITAEPALNPATGATCAWIPARAAAVVSGSGLTIWNAPEFLILSLSAVFRRKAADFIGIDEARAMLYLIAPVFPQLVAETVPKTVSWFVLADVLRRLVAEGISIRNLRRILMALADLGRLEEDPLFLTEHVRTALQREITYRFSRGTNQLIVFLLHPDIETLIRSATRHTPTGSYIDLEPDRLRSILNAIHEPMTAIGNQVQAPQILTPMEIRSSVRRLVAIAIPRLHVVSYQELLPSASIQPVGRICLDGFIPRPGVRIDGVPLWD